MKNATIVISLITIVVLIMLQIRQCNTNQDIKMKYYQNISALSQKMKTDSINNISTRDIYVASSLKELKYVNDSLYNAVKYLQDKVKHSEVQIVYKTNTITTLPDTILKPVYVQVIDSTQKNVSWNYEFYQKGLSVREKITNFRDTKNGIDDLNITDFSVTSDFITGVLYDKSTKLYKVFVKPTCDLVKVGNIEGATLDKSFGQKAKKPRLVVSVQLGGGFLINPKKEISYGVYGGIGLGIPIITLF